MTFICIIYTNVPSLRIQRCRLDAIRQVMFAGANTEACMRQPSVQSDILPTTSRPPASGRSSSYSNKASDTSAYAQLRTFWSPGLFDHLLSLGLFETTFFLLSVRPLVSWCKTKIGKKKPRNFRMVRPLVCTKARKVQISIFRSLHTTSLRTKTGTDLPLICHPFIN